MPKLLQRTISKFWPIALLAMVIVTPLLVKKSYDELKQK